MTTVTFHSSAPGKLVLLGEYAVLVGAGALVAAVNRRARVAVRATERPGWTVDAAALGISGARATLTADGRVRWSDPLTAGQLALVGSVLEWATRSDPAPPARITIDTGALYEAADDLAPPTREAATIPSTPRTFVPGTKLGLGSSAALTVALAGALAVAAGRAEPTVGELLGTHRLAQGGRGSGIDIAASLHGGVLHFRRSVAGVDGVASVFGVDGVASVFGVDGVDGVDGVHVQPVTLPAALFWCAVWTGSPASTGTFLTRIADWRAAEPRRHDRLMDRMAQTSADGIGAVQRQDAAAALCAVDAYARLLQQLGEASGADIVSADHQRLGMLASASGVSYKSCGAGGGDVGVALTTEPARLELFREQARKAGFRPLDLAVDPLGLSAHRDPS